MISKDGMAALRALHDCGVASARWDHPGYRNLRENGVVTHRAIDGGAKVSHRLNERGRAMAEELFK